MKQIDRYIIKSYLFSLMVCSVSLSGLYVVIDIFQKIDNFLKRDDPFLPMIFNHYLWQVPFHLLMFVPLLTVTAAIFTLTRMARSNELVPMKAAGISMHRIILPMFLIACLISAVMFGAQEWFIPTYAEQIQKARVSHLDAVRSSNSQLVDDTPTDHTLVLYASRYSVPKKAMTRVWIDRVAKTGGEQYSHTFADRVVWEDNPGRPVGWYMYSDPQAAQDRFRKRVRVAVAARAQRRAKKRAKEREEQGLPPEKPAGPMDRPDDQIDGLPALLRATHGDEPLATGISFKAAADLSRGVNEEKSVNRTLVDESPADHTLVIHWLRCSIPRRTLHDVWLVKVSKDHSERLEQQFVSRLVWIDHGWRLYNDPGEIGADPLARPNDAIEKPLSILRPQQPGETLATGLTLQAVEEASRGKNDKHDQKNVTLTDRSPNGHDLLIHWLYYHRATKTMRGVWLVQVTKDGTRRRTQQYASRLVWTHDRWTIYNDADELGVLDFRKRMDRRPKKEWLRSIDPNGERLELSYGPAQVALMIRSTSVALFGGGSSQFMTLGELKAYTDAYPHHGSERVALYQRLLLPLSNLILFFLGVSFALQRESRSVLIGIGTALLVCFMFYGLNILCQSLGAAGNMAPFLAAILPIAAFLGVAIYKFDAIPT